MADFIQASCFHYPIVLRYIYTIALYCYYLITLYHLYPIMSREDSSGRLEVRPRTSLQIS
jgi:hypothetical protein